MPLTGDVDMLQQCCPHAQVDKGKATAHATKAYAEHEVELRSLITSRLGRNEWSASRPGRLTLGEETLIPIIEEAGRAPQPALTVWRKEKYIASVGIRTTIPRLTDRSLVTIATE